MVIIKTATESVSIYTFYREYLCNSCRRKHLLQESEKVINTEVKTPPNFIVTFVASLLLIVIITIQEYFICISVKEYRKHV